MNRHFLDNPINNGEAVSLEIMEATTTFLSREGTGGAMQRLATNCICIP